MQLTVLFSLAVVVQAFFLDLILVDIFKFFGLSNNNILPFDMLVSSQLDSRGIEEFCTGVDEQAQRYDSQTSFVNLLHIVSLVGYITSFF